ncbi:MAG TPA: hypothetical protein VG692_19215 [Gemmatimonadales bacterium]|nr:hypothetical protein [Gemmatimonadales bacterium]
MTACTAKTVGDFVAPPPGPPTTGPAELRPAAGLGQAGPAGSTLPVPLAVRVFDSTGVPFPGIAVTWAVTTGGGLISPIDSITDAQGIASASWQLGDSVGTQSVTASSPSLDDATFTAIAQPVLVRVELLPSSVNLQTGGAQLFTAQGVYRDGSRATIPITWSATGGTIDQNGQYAAGQTAGVFRVIARQQGGGLADTATVSISSPTATLQRIVLSPSSATVQVGSSQQFSVNGVMSDGSNIVPQVTYTATGGTINSNGLYVPGSSTGNFRVIAVQVGGTLADTSTVAVTAAPPPPPPGGGGSVLFHSDWSTGTGSSDGVIRDNGKAVPWSSRWGGNGSLSVVAASGLGFPATMTNVLRVQHYQQDFDWVMANNLWQLPAVGSAIYFRVYLRNTVGDNVDAGSSYASTHPVESEGNPNGISGGYYAMHYGSYADGTFPFYVNVNNAAYPYNGWTPGAPSSTHGGRNYDPATLVKNTTYRVEWKFTRVAAGRYDLDMRIYGSDDKTLLFDRSNIFAWGGSRQTLATNGSNLPIDDAHMTELRIGINGGFATPSPQFVYWGGFAVCANDWCGPYGTY